MYVVVHQTQKRAPSARIERTRAEAHRLGTPIGQDSLGRTHLIVANDFGEHPLVVARVLRASEVLDVALEALNPTDFKS